MADKSMIVNKLQQITTAKERMADRQAQLDEIQKHITALASAGGNRNCRRKLQAIAKQLNADAEAYALAYSEGYAMIASIVVRYKDGSIDQKDTEICQRIMERRYLQGQSWERIACDTDYSWRQVMRLHAKALKILAKTCN